MSEATQNAFVAAVKNVYDEFQVSLTLAEPTFEQRGFSSRASMSNEKGSVEILCGPPEYNVEVFITDSRSGIRSGLPELVADEEIRNWLRDYRQNAEADSEMIEDIIWVFRMLIDCLSQKENFKWLSRR